MTSHRRCRTPSHPRAESSCCVLSAKTMAGLVSLSLRSRVPRLTISDYYSHAGSMRARHFTSSFTRSQDALCDRPRDDNVMIGDCASTTSLVAIPAPSSSTCPREYWGRGVIRSPSRMLRWGFADSPHRIEATTIRSTAILAVLESSASCARHAPTIALRRRLS